MIERMGRTFPAALIAFLSLPILAFAQQQSNQQANWILYERANAMAAQREYGQALRLYKEAISQGGIFPEAEVGIGDVYYEEGELELARQQYEKAYNIRKAFNVSDSQYDVLYKLAHLFEGQEMFRLMEDDLLKIVGDDKRYSDPASSYLRAQVEKNFLEKGIDHTLLLYQISVPFATEAHSRLGWFYYRTGRYTQAVSHLLYAVAYRTKGIEDYLHETDVDYQYKSLGDVLGSIDADRKLSASIAGTDYYKDLYYLAGASYASGYPAHATQLWRLLSAARSSETYSQLASRQLKSPWTEKLLGADRLPRGGR